MAPPVPDRSPDATTDATTDRLLALSEVFRAFAEVTADLGALLDTVARTATSLVADAAVVLLTRGDSRLLEHGAVHARDERGITALREGLARAASYVDEGLATYVTRTGETVLIPSSSPEQLAALSMPAFADAARELAVHSYLAIPLEVHGRRLGVVVLARYLPTSPGFSEHDRAFARSIGDHAALAIANAQLFESLQRELRERQRAEDEAKTFVALIENSTDMIAMAALDGQVLFVNSAGRALVGLSLDRDVRELRLSDFHTEDGLARGPIIQAKGSWQGEGVLRHFVTGELIPTQLSSFLMRDSTGRVLGYATVQRDLRDTKRLEAELRQAHKMEALGRLAGGIAHDFNNLLTVILSYAALLQRRLPADSRETQDLAQIERAGLRAAELTRQLLAFSRRQVLAPEPLDLAATLRAMDDMLRRLIGEDIELRVRARADAGAVMVDAGQVEQVVMNLVVNARDAMRGGGVLALETARVTLPAGVFVMLAVSDTGAGIDAETRAHLFEPFFTTKDRGTGTGLGLSTVMGIVEQSGGHIEVDSELGRGTTFRVYLPATTQAPPPLHQTPPGGYPAVRGTERILVVEDEAAVRALVCEVLGQAGFEVIAAGDGAHALELAARISGEIDLLLTDVIMPRMSGRQLAAQLTAQRPGTRVLYMSGYTDDELGHHGLLDPDIALVQKPLTPDVLLHRVRQLLR